MPRHAPSVLCALAAVALSGCYFHLDTTDWSESDYVGSVRSSSVEKYRDSNRERLAQLQVGMTVHDVQSLFGTKSIRSSGIGQIHNPYRTESFLDRDGQPVLIFYYYTGVQRRDNLIKDDELTPVAFRDGKVVGWGWSYFDREIRKID